jgi:hypothetical protein
MRPRVGVHELEADSKWQLFKDFAEAPTGDFNESVNISGKPIGAI